MNALRREAAPSQSAWAGERLDEARWPVTKVAKMANHTLGCSIRLVHLKVLNTTYETARQGVAVATLLLLMVVSAGWAQEIDPSALQVEAASHKTQDSTPVASHQAATAQTSASQTSAQQPSPSQSGQPQPQPANSVYLLPPGTKLPLGLLRPLRVKPGRDVYLQITFPVTVGSQMLIPPGAYVQGVVEKVIKKDRRSLQFAINSANLIFSNGYTVPISGTVTVGTTNAALTSPQPGSGGGQSIPAMAAVGSVTPPPLPPLPSFNTMRNVMIGVGVATAVGTVVLIALARNGDPEIEVGTPLESFCLRRSIWTSRELRQRSSSTTSRPAIHRYRSCSLQSNPRCALTPAHPERRIR